ncbi:MAG: hypothetical protein GY819_07365 [Planctomycetaceae bacterium]|nr:hypothetical protein [Planctomycetaceae bacterium]MCP4462601.1 hypothetical protein [Planctomycetaceae bacterium]MDG1807176.1 hypothetical protein [Pirellulaceae bacterium]
MSTADSFSPREKVKLRADTRASSYDKTSAMLVASVVVIGAFVFILFMIWLSLFSFGSPAKMPPPILELAGNDNRPEGVSDDWQPPGVEEFPEVTEPQLADALEAVTESISTVRAQLEKVDGNAVEMGSGSGEGDKRAKGPGSGNSNIIPEWERWKIEYQAGTMAEYMSILQSFEIYLGSVSQVSNQILFFTDLNNPRPTMEPGNRKSPKAQNLYFRNTKSRLKRWDQNKVLAGGGDVDNKIVVQFYPPAVRQKLLQLEQAVYLEDGKDLTEVRQTLFRCRAGGGGYEYYVEDIKYRPKPK